MQWWKKLSKSDARQETEGGFMPFRFTQEHCPGNLATWFRDEFFGDIEWQNTKGKNDPLEEADLKIDVKIMGQDFGQKNMKLTHAEGRNKNNNAPTTHLNFDSETKEYLHENDMTGKSIVFSKELDGNFKLVIQDEEPQ